MVKLNYRHLFLIGVIFLAVFSRPLQAQGIFEGNIDAFIPKIKQAVSRYYVMSIECLMDDSMREARITGISNNYLMNNFMGIPDFLPNPINEGVYDYDNYISLLIHQYGEYGRQNEIRTEQENFKFTHKTWTDDKQGIVITVTFDNRFFCGDKLLYTGRTQHVICFPNYLDFYNFKFKQVSPADWDPLVPSSTTFIDTSSQTAPITLSNSTANEYLSNLQTSKRSPSTDNSSSLSPICITYNADNADSIIQAVTKAIHHRKYDQALTILKKAQVDGFNEPLCYLGYLYECGIADLPVDSITSFHYYQQSFLTGHPRGVYFMARCYRNGFMVKQNLKKAFKLAKQSSDGGDSYGMNLLGILYQDGIGTSKNFQKMMIYYNKSADLDNPFAYYNLYSIYKESKNDVKTLEYLIKAEELGDIDASSELIEVYRTGKLGCKPDATKMLHYVERAGNLGYGLGYDTAGDYYMSSSFANSIKSPDTLKAINSYKQAIKLKHYRSAEKLGRIICNSSSSFYNVSESAKYYKLAADSAKRSGNACYITASNYFLGKGVPKDNRLAFHYAQQGSKYSYANCHYLYGYYLENGIGCSRNLNEAFIAYSKAAKRQNAAGLCALGICYIDGIGTEIDINKGLEYLQKAANQNYPYANYRLGYYWLYTIGYIPKAMFYFEKGRTKGDAASSYELAMIYYKERAKASSARIAFNLFCESYRFGSFKACKILGDCYAKGIGTDIDLNQAKHYYKIASDKGDISAKKALADLLFK